MRLRSRTRQRKISSRSAPCAVPMRRSRIGQRINDEPFETTSVTWRSLQPFLKRLSRTLDPGPNVYPIAFKFSEVTTVGKSGPRCSLCEGSIMAKNHQVGTFDTCAAIKTSQSVNLLDHLVAASRTLTIVPSLYSYRLGGTSVLGNIEKLPLMINLNIVRVLRIVSMGCFAYMISPDCPPKTADMLARCYISRCYMADTLTAAVAWVVVWWRLRAPRACVNTSTCTSRAQYALHVQPYLYKRCSRQDLD
jgi:hypothetical protein